MKQLYVCIDGVDYKVHMLSYSTQTIQVYNGTCSWNNDLPNIDEYNLDEINYELKLKLEGEKYMKRKIKLSDGEIQSFMVKGKKNPCGCGSNCFHKEDDGVNILGVCNACNEDIYQYDEREEFKEWRYK